MLKKSTELEEMTKNIVDGMQSHDIKRIIYTASAGINKEVPGFYREICDAIIKKSSNRSSECC